MRETFIKAWERVSDLRIIDLFVLLVLEMLAIFVGIGFVQTIIHLSQGGA